MKTIQTEVKAMENEIGNTMIRILAHYHEEFPNIWPINVFVSNKHGDWMLDEIGAHRMAEVDYATVLEMHYMNEVAPCMEYTVVLLYPQEMRVSPAVFGADISEYVACAYASSVSAAAAAAQREALWSLDGIAGMECPYTDPEVFEVVRVVEGINLDLIRGESRAQVSIM
jgi:hypothetical protein